MIFGVRFWACFSVHLMADIRRRSLRKGLPPIQYRLPLSRAPNSGNLQLTPTRRAWAGSTRPAAGELQQESATSALRSGEAGSLPSIGRGSRGSRATLARSISTPWGSGSTCRDEIRPAPPRSRLVIQNQGSLRLAPRLQRGSFSSSLHTNSRRKAPGISPSAGSSAPSVPRTSRYQPFPSNASELRSPQVTVWMKGSFGATPCFAAAGRAHQVLLPSVRNTHQRR